jgi:hypothetical protein
MTEADNQLFAFATSRDGDVVRVDAFSPDPTIDEAAAAWIEAVTGVETAGFIPGNVGTFTGNVAIAQINQLTGEL